MVSALFARLEKLSTGASGVFVEVADAASAILSQDSRSIYTLNLAKSASARQLDEKQGDAG